MASLIWGCASFSGLYHCNFKYLLFCHPPVHSPLSLSLTDSVIIWEWLLVIMFFFSDATGPRDGATPPQETSPREVPPTGWAALGLTYKVQWPLHILFTPAVLEKCVLTQLPTVAFIQLSAYSKYSRWASSPPVCSSPLWSGTTPCSGTCWVCGGCSRSCSTAGLYRCRGNTSSPARRMLLSGDYATTWRSWSTTCSTTCR